MTRKIKMLVLAVTAVFAFAAVSATAASAKTFFFHSSSAGSTNVTASKVENHVFTTNAGTVTCKTAHFSGTQAAATSTELTLGISYKECTAFGFVGVTIDTTGCDYLFTSHTTKNGVTENFKVHLKCEAGKSIEITVPGCTTKVGEQTLEGLTPTNKESGGVKDVLADINTSGITYNECGTVRTNGTYKGSSTVTGTNSGGSAVSVWYE